MKVGTSTAAVIPSNAKLVSSKNTFIGAVTAGRVNLSVEDTFDINGDGLADIRRLRTLNGTAKLLEGDLRSGGTITSERFVITDLQAGKQVFADDSRGAGRLSSVLTFDLKTRTVSGEKDLNGDFTVDKKIETMGGKFQISTSSKKDGQFDVVESKNSLGW